MVETRKILAQASPTAANLTDIYTVGVGTQSVVSTLTVCNRSSSSGDLFRVSVAIGGAGNANSQYVYYDVLIDPNDTFAATIGLTLNTGDVLRAYSLSGTLSFNLFGVEIT